MQGFWDTIKDIAGDVGITGETATATARAFASPTLSNIRAVETAFNNAGTSAPPELMNQLYSRYYDSIQRNPIAVAGSVQSTFTDLLPWLIGGGLLFILISKRKG